MSQIDEYISSSPTYQEVPDFQRVQITGDYASGVSCSWSLTAGKTLSLIVSASYFPPLPFEKDVSSPALCYTWLRLKNNMPGLVFLSCFHIFVKLFPRNFSFISFLHMGNMQYNAMCVWHNMVGRFEQKNQRNQLVDCSHRGHHKAGKGASRRHRGLLGKDGARADVE